MTLRTKVFRALRWVAIARFAGQICTWVITLFVIRLLSPDDYGLMAMAAVLIGFATLVNELGFIPALIQAKDVSEDLVRQVFGVVLVSNFVIFLLVLLIAPYVAVFFEEGSLTPIAQVLAVTLLISALSAVPSAMLHREIRFEGLSVAEFLAMVVGSLVTLAAAILGLGVWSLVAGNLVRATAMTIGVLIVSRFRLTPLFRFGGLGRLFVFGTKTTVQKVLWYANTQLDVLLVGKLLGNHSLGLYSVAMHLANVPMSKVMGLVNQVAFPAYSQLRDDVGQASAYYFKTVQLASIVFFPLLWGLSSVAPDFVTVVLGEKWAGAILALQIVALLVPFRVLLVLLNPVILGLGHPGLAARNTLTFTVLMLPAVGVGTLWGLTGVCVGLAVAVLATWAINLRRSLGLFGRSLRDLLSTVVPSILSAAIMYAVVSMVRMFLMADASAVWRLAISILMGAAVYAVMTFVLNRNVAFWSLKLLWIRT